MRSIPYGLCIGTCAVACLVMQPTLFAADAAKGGTMKMGEPMSGEMKRPGMKKGDVKKREEQWSRKMKGALEKDEAAMPAPAPGR